MHDASFPGWHAPVISTDAGKVVPQIVCAVRDGRHLDVMQMHCA